MARPTEPALIDLLALSLVPGLGPKLTAALLQHFGSASAVRNASAADLQCVPMIGDKLSRSFAAAMASADLVRECELLDRHATEVVALGHTGYPSRLAEVAGAPPLLYVRGSVSAADARAVAIVGSRGCTAYGRRITDQIAGGLARAGVTVVSGMARGIDGVAHSAALKAGGRTIGVLAGGLSRIYPPEHADLAAAVQANGALVSEVPMAMEPRPEMFPPRNRIISGMTLAVVIVEASERSGTLITARHAGEQGRDVLAVPGPVDNPASAGCLQLIREGATLIRNVDDVLEAIDGMAVTSAPVLSPAASPPPELDGTAKRVWDFLADGAKHADTLAQELQLSVPEISRTMMHLEMRKLVRRLPGNCYERR
ncbi:MAG: DNA-processing protein DprA [Gemmataceae bacterium]